MPNPVPGPHIYGRGTDINRLEWETTNDKQAIWHVDGGRLHVGGLRESECTQKEQKSKKKKYKKKRSGGMGNVYSLPHRFGDDDFDGVA